MLVNDFHTASVPFHRCGPFVLFSDHGDSSFIVIAFLDVHAVTESRKSSSPITLKRN